MNVLHCTKFRLEKSEHKPAGLDPSSMVTNENPTPVWLSKVHGALKAWKLEQPQTLAPSLKNGHRTVQALAHFGPNSNNPP
jgi:hypothetical protein